jgi:hypothetical protein
MAGWALTAEPSSCIFLHIEHPVYELSIMGLAECESAAHAHSAKSVPSRPRSSLTQCYCLLYHSNTFPRWHISARTRRSAAYLLGRMVTADLAVQTLSMRLKRTQQPQRGTAFQATSLIRRRLSSSRPCATLVILSPVSPISRIPLTPLQQLPSAVCLNGRPFSLAGPPTITWSRHLV